jgi:hypothetical protein
LLKLAAARRGLRHISLSGQLGIAHQQSDWQRPPRLPGLEKGNTTKSLSPRRRGYVRPL